MCRPTACLVLLLVLPALTPAADAVGYSGMVRISDNSYLTVNDRKATVHPGFRIGVLTVTPDDGTVFHPLTVRDWGKGEPPPSDLEACCAVPGRVAEYLLAESGEFKAKYGRVFHVRVDRDGESGWQAKCLGAFKPDRPPTDDQGSTWEGDQIEGMACLPGFEKDKPILIFGERGGKVKDGHKFGRLVWGELDLTNDYRLTKLGDAALASKSVLPGGRDCSDLHVVEKDKGWVVWSVATRDGGDAGPFHSAVYRAGKFVLDADAKKVRFDREEKPASVRHLHGLKVEALAGPPKAVPGSEFSVGTDDEAFGGVWRTLFAEE